MGSEHRVALLVLHFSRWVALALLFAFCVNTIAGASVRKSEPFKDDDFAVFVQGVPHTFSVRDMDERGWAQAATVVEPWAASYWPIYRGILAHRYSDPDFPQSKSFHDHHNAFLSKPPQSVVAAGAINSLSPAEKYDLLVGDSSWALTRFMWQKGLDTMRDFGGIAAWTGICHGWAAANNAGVPPPVKSVTVKDVTGRYDITFYPHDIKALQSFLWAESSPPSIRAGNRCRQYQVSRDPFMRPLEVSCLDSNPMTWHLAVTHLVAAQGRGFVMDSAAGPEVWNYPVASYDYSYFHPKTFEPTENVSAALVPIERLTNDRYKSHRSPRARYVVGVIMDVYHPALIEPSRGKSTRVNHSKRFIYDLELDESQNIVGGEWYSSDRPDFIWGFASGSRALTHEDIRFNLTWDARTPLSEAVASGARAASARGKVVAAIANALSSASLITDTLASPAPTETPPDAPVITVESPDDDGETS